MGQIKTVFNGDRFFKKKKPHFPTLDFGGGRPRLGPFLNFFWGLRENNLF